MDTFPTLAQRRGIDSHRSSELQLQDRSCIKVLNFTSCTYLEQHLVYTLHRQTRHTARVNTTIPVASLRHNTRESDRSTLHVPYSVREATVHRDEGREATLTLSTP